MTAKYSMLNNNIMFSFNEGLLLFVIPVYSTINKTEIMFDIVEYRVADWKVMIMIDVPG